MTRHYIHEVGGDFYVSTKRYIEGNLLKLNDIKSQGLYFDAEWCKDILSRSYHIHLTGGSKPIQLFKNDKYLAQNFPENRSSKEYKLRINNQFENVRLSKPQVKEQNSTITHQKLSAKSKKHIGGDISYDKVQEPKPSALTKKAYDYDYDDIELKHIHAFLNNNFSKIDIHSYLYQVIKKNAKKNTYDMYILPGVHMMKSNGELWYVGITSKKLTRVPGDEIVTDDIFQKILNSK